MPVDFFAFLTARAAVSLVTAMLTIAIGSVSYTHLRAHET